MRQTVAVGFWILLLSASLAFGQDMLRDAIPRKWIDPLLPEKLPALTLPEYITNDPLELATAQAFRGRYKLALMTLKNVPADADQTRLAVLRATIYRAQGKTNDALKVLSALGTAKDEQAGLLHAQLLLDLGQTDQAIELLKSQVAAAGQAVSPRFYLGQAYEQAGQTALAREQYEWFVTPPHNYLDLWMGGGERVFTRADEVTLIAKAIDRWALLEGKYTPAMHNTVLNMFVKTFDLIDRDYWPARVAAAAFYLSRGDTEKAAGELGAANKINPQSADIDAMMGEIAIDARKLPLATQCAQSLRAVNPPSSAADVLDARVAIAEYDFDTAERLLKRAIAKPGVHVRELGLLAGLAIAGARESESAAYMKQADEASPNQWQASYEAADMLFQLHMLKACLSMAKTAIDRAPWEIAPRNLIGLIYLQSGEDDLARAALAAAYAVDPFHPQTVNYLRLLDMTKTYLRHETEHFIFIYDKPDHPIVPLYIAPYMEEAYAEVTGLFKSQPAEKTIIQIYPDESTLSVRVAGAPGLESYAFAFGRLIVSGAPRAGQNVGNFNWARVIKHEFAHVVHLQETEGRVPRWLTEGLAVMVENVDYRFSFVPPVLYQRATEKKLLSIDKLRTFFIAPTGGPDGEIAYMTGFWIGKYIRQQFGDDAIPRLLAAYKQGMTDDQAFRQALGQSVSQFEPAFAEWAKERVRHWGYDKETTAKVQSLTVKGESLIKSRQYVKAAEVWEEIAKLRPMDMLPHQRLAGLYSTKESANPDLAIDNLKVLQRIELRDNRYAKRIASAYKDKGELEQALAFAKQAVYVDPYDPAAHDLLQAIHAAMGNTVLAEQERQVSATLVEAIEKKRKASEDGAK